MLVLIMVSNKSDIFEHAKGFGPQGFIIMRLESRSPSCVNFLFVQLSFATYHSVNFQGSLLNLILSVGSSVNNKINVGMLQKVGCFGNAHFIFSCYGFWSMFFSYLIPHWWTFSGESVHSSTLLGKFCAGNIQCAFSRESQRYGVGFFVLGLTGIFSMIVSHYCDELRVFFQYSMH